MSRRPASLLPWLLVAGFIPQLPEAPRRERDQLPRKFTDARKAEAEAKRQRKAAKRAKAVRHD